MTSISGSKPRSSILAAMAASLLIVFGLASMPQLALAQTPTATPAPVPPDWTTLGYSTVLGTANFTPGTATSVSGGGHTVQIPANLNPNPAKFELLTAQNSDFASRASGYTLVSGFAWRVTDTTTNQRVGTFGSPVQWSYTGSGVTPQSLVLNFTSAPGSNGTPNSTPTDISGQTAKHSFTSQGVGWFLANPAGAAAAPAATAAAPAAAAPVAAPPSSATVPAQATARAVPAAPPNTGVGPGPARAGLPPSAAQVTSAAAPQLPSTGSGGLLSPGQSDSGGSTELVLLGALALLLGGAVLSRSRRRA